MAAVIASRKLFIGIAAAITLGCGFMQYALPDAATRRAGKQFACRVEVRRSAAGPAPGWRNRSP